jgi:hypothetical protein
VINVGTYLRYPMLAGLDVLVRAQRRLEALLGNEKGSFAEQDKAVRKQIDGLLADAGIAQSEFVTCNGYDVTRRGQKGRSSINTERLVERLVLTGLTRVDALQLVLECTDTGDASTWAEVKPSKGAKVRK